MFSNNKRLFAVISAAFTPIFAALWATVLSKSAWTGWPYLYVGAISVIAGLAAYFVHLRPARDLEKPVLQLLTVLSEKPLRIGKKHHIGPRLNIMVVRRPWYCPWQQRLVIVWGSNMNNHPDVRFSCRANQGVSGEALRRHRPVLKNCEGVPREMFGFTLKQAEQTAHVTAVWSWPIYELDGKGNQTGDVGGVLNLDATEIGAANTLMANYETYEKYLKRLSEVASTIV